MPRNDQITRQWYLLRRLENSHPLTLPELVDSVPDDYPKNARTVRRDLEALEAVGFPLVIERHNGQTCWRLIEGFRNIPALGFSATELMALTFSQKLLRPLEGTEIQSALNSALNKVASALPPQGHEYIRALDSCQTCAIF
jgi:predicted DNA-binding transcriptional regulator YafY